MLTDRDRSLLEFEERWLGHSGAKEAAIRSEFGLTSARYYQLLNHIIDSPDALAASPMHVKRLLNARATRSARRVVRAFPQPA